MTNTDTMRATVRKQLFAPLRNAECLCGSGLKFKRCCADNLPGFDIGKKARKAFSQGDYSVALTAIRADITQYTIWHKTNTEPVLRAKPEFFTTPGKKTLLEIDVGALSDHVESLQSCYQKLGRPDEFPVALERLRSNINHSRWHRRIIYLHALHALSPNWNEIAGQQELKKLGSMEAEADVEILQLYIDLFGSILGFAERQRLVDRVILIAEKEVDRLHYRCLKAIGYLMIGDQQGAELELSSALASYQASRNESSESLYEKHRYAMATELQGRLRNDFSLLDITIQLCSELLDSDKWTEAGRASVYRQLGDALRCKSEWGAAKDAYAKAIELQNLPIFKVFLAECLLHLDGPKVAASTLNSISIADLDTSEAIDYVFTFALVAIEGGEEETLKSAEQLLRNRKIPEPYFQKHRETLLLSIIDTLRNGPSATRTQSARLILKGMVSTITRYLKLEPNIMGIGLNVGKMLEDYGNSKSKDAEQNQKKS